MKIKTNYIIYKNSKPKSHCTTLKDKNKEIELIFNKFLLNFLRNSIHYIYSKIINNHEYKLQNTEKYYNT